MTGETTHIISVDLSFVLPDGEINGTLRIDHGPKQAWYAQPTRHPDLARAGHLHAHRPWAAADPAGEGYEFHLPADLDGAGDIMRRRVALALEEFLYAKRDGKLCGPYHRQITLSVDTDTPTWDLNVPVIAAADRCGDDTL